MPNSVLLNKRKYDGLPEIPVEVSTALIRRMALLMAAVSPFGDKSGFARNDAQRLYGELLWAATWWYDPAGGKKVVNLHWCDPAAIRLIGEFMADELGKAMFESHYTFRFVVPAQGNANLEAHIVGRSA